MQKQQPIQRTSGAKTIAIDGREMIACYRFLKIQFWVALLAAAFFTALHLFFGR